MRFAVFALLLLGCSKKESPEELPPPAASAAPSAPVDHLASGELVEGKEKAFGLALPRDLAVKKRYSDLVYTAGPMGQGPLTKYFQARVREGTVHTTLTETTFDNVRVPGEPKSSLRIRIDADPAGAGSLVEIRDTTPPPLENLPDEAARWKAVGMTPNGQLVDPKHLH
jgi:hypothetical protein